MVLEGACEEGGEGGEGGREGGRVVGTSLQPSSKLHVQCDVYPTIAYLMITPGRRSKFFSMTSNSSEVVSFEVPYVST